MSFESIKPLDYPRRGRRNGHEMTITDRMLRVPFTEKRTLSWIKP